MTNITHSATATHKPRPLVDLLVSILIPSLILMKFSGEAKLGADGALVLALAFPLGWGTFELLKYRKFNFIALLGLVSVLLTGGIGLLRLDNQWLAIKEAAIPGLIGIAVLVSTRTRYPLIRTMLFNRSVLNVDKIQQRLEQANHTQHFEARLMSATYWLSGTFFFSSAMNYVLAKWIVISVQCRTRSHEFAQLPDDCNPFDDHAAGDFLLPMAHHPRPYWLEAGRDHGRPRAKVVTVPAQW